MAVSDNEVGGPRDGSAPDGSAPDGSAPGEPAPRRPHHYGPIPRLDLLTWRLTVSGETADGGVVSFTWADIGALPTRSLRVPLMCAEAGPGATHEWGGVPAAELVRLVPPSRGVGHALAIAAYGYSSTVRVSDLLDADALLVTSLDGEPLPREHGGPLRLLLPHLYGWKSPKWLLDIHYCSEPKPGFWEGRGYHRRGEVARGERYAHDG